MKKGLSVIILGFMAFMITGCEVLKEDYKQTGEEWHNMTPQERKAKIEKEHREKEGLE